MVIFTERRSFDVSLQTEKVQIKIEFKIAIFRGFAFGEAEEEFAIDDVDQEKCRIDAGYVWEDLGVENKVGLVVDNNFIAGGDNEVISQLGRMSKPFRI